MKINELIPLWLLEEEKTFTGWDFSYLANRTATQELPWDYKTTVLSYMKSTSTLLDMGTGGGELLLSLSPPKGQTYATEAYAPNYELCKQTLPAFGIDVRPVSKDHKLPFESEFFDLVINRHESFSAQEVHRILKPGGMFITQQVGGQNNRELSAFLLGQQSSLTDANFNLQACRDELMKARFTIVEEKEHFPLLQFFDVGALVYFAKIIEWEFPGFSVQKCLNKLILLQEKLEKDGSIRSTEHRFFMTARK
ncbi:class I SAM-dependent methyltransferase [Paenibacillus sp. PL91]|uniref:class I SAM-dependent methyltransferase n=1 Tax=Paenibacillus sp. PL91 TaxID=2729538 RepID=UPI00145E62E6|nr:class I SAM-dependent methyltransferase [Paenibacillus sp. PL91]MBC9202041.1 class I SAM-dependent methyltransferase [Paenibacillus sp. PL91]